MSQARQFTGTLIQRKTACAPEDNTAGKAVALAPASPADPGALGGVKFSGCWMNMQ
jgi:hypothetical protein